MSSRSSNAVGPPLLGGLLRLARQELVNEVERELARAGVSDVRQAQWSVTQHLATSKEGLRLTDLAAYAGMTKPSMSALVDQLVASGYAERAADPDDQRAQRVRFTKRGWRFAAVARTAVTKVEEMWAARIGSDDVETLRRILRTIVETRPRKGARPS